MHYHRNSGSNRGLGIAALAVALFISFGLGAYAVGLGEPEYQSYRSGQSKEHAALPTIADVPVGVEQHTPCNNPKSESESDLCAQWRAAKAAEKSATWSMLGVFASIAGIALLLWQIMLTRVAVEDTGKATEAMREANQISETQSENQIRAWLAIDLSEGAQFRTENGQPTIKTKFKITNMGNTPAIAVYWFCRFDVDVEPLIQMDIIHSYFRKEMLLPEKNLFPGGSHECSGDWCHDGELPSWGTGYFTIVVFYKTVFSDTLRATTALFEVHDRRNEDNGADFSQPISSTDLRIVPWAQCAGMVD